MNLFSQRMGLKPVKEIMQTDNIDKDLKNSLWNVVSLMLTMKGMQTICDALILSLWINYFKLKVDDIPKYYPDRRGFLRDYFFSCKWNEVYDFLEYIAKYCWEKNIDRNFTSRCNSMLERENSAYRFVGTEITQITTDEEIETIEESLSLSGKFGVVKEHIKTSLEKLSDRENPDYRNSIKESISAVESACKIVTSDKTATPAKVLKRLENDIELHPALSLAFNKLYGYTSDADGIRHALMDQTELNYEDAKFFLVACSAFCNYLIAKADKI